MNKFLRLVEQNRPEADTYTVELKDAAGSVADSFEMWGTSSPPRAFVDFRTHLSDEIETDQELSTFLTLVDEYTPSENKYTVELKDFNGDPVPNYFFEVQGTDDFRKFIHDQFDEFKGDWGAPIPVEDQETTVDASVRAAADQGDPDAIELVKKREEADGGRAEVVKKINKAYEASVEKDVEETGELEAALADAQGII